MYRTLLPAKGLPEMEMTEAGISTASAAMPRKASASIAIRAEGRMKAGAGMPVMIAVSLSTSRIYPSAVYLSYSAALPSFVPSQAAIRC